ncbi:helix-hairpin-helix domain-containing protein [Desulfovibrionales bacterium]
MVKFFQGVFYVLLLLFVLGTPSFAAELVDINTATEAQLVALPGIGPAIAAKIIEYRTTTPFTSPEQIMDVKGIGPAKFEAIKNLISVSSPEPAPAAEPAKKE